MKASLQQTAMHDAPPKRRCGECLTMVIVVMIFDLFGDESVECAQSQLIIRIPLVAAVDNTYHHQARRISAHITIESHAWIEAEAFSSSGSKTHV